MLAYDRQQDVPFIRLGHFIPPADRPRLSSARQSISHFSSKPVLVAGIISDANWGTSETLLYRIALRGRVPVLSHDRKVLEPFACIAGKLDTRGLARSG